MRRIVNEALEGGEGEKVLSNKEVRLFKHLNEKKHELGTKEELISYIKMMLKLMGKSPSDAVVYYHAYTMNFRPEGDYENLTKDNFVNFKDFAQKRTTNVTSWEYTTATIPFKGSNLEGSWQVNYKNQWYYVVKSYNWYPIYLYKDNQWYSVDNYYSSSTSKQMSHSRPRVWDENLNETIIRVSPEEMKQLINGKTLEEIEQTRFQNFEGDIESYTKLPPKLKTFGWGNDSIKANYVLKNIEIQGNDVIMYINVIKAGKLDGRKMIPETNFEDSFKTKLNDYLKEYYEDLYGQKIRGKNLIVNVKYPN